MTWTSLHLKRVAHISYGLSQPPTLSAPGIPIIRATNISRGRIISDGMIYATKGNLPLDRVPLLREGEILVVRSGAYTGDSALITASWADCAPGYDLRVSPTNAHPPYVAYCLLSSYALDQMSLASTRAAQPHLNAEDLGGIAIRIPTLTEQRRIADFLDAETARIDELQSVQTSVIERVHERDRSVRDSFVDSLVSDVGELPLRRYGSRVEQGTSSPCLSHPRQLGEWGIIKLSAVKRGKFFPDENKRLPDEVEPAFQHELHNGDLLVTRANTPTLVGDVAVVRGAMPRLLLPDLIYRVGLHREMRPEFVAQVFLSTRVRSLIEAEARGSSQSMVKIRGEDIRGWPVPRANEKQQIAFVSAVEARMESSANLRIAIQRQLELIAERHKALITVAVTGQIDVTTARRIDLPAWISA